MLGRRKRPLLAFDCAFALLIRLLFYVIFFLCTCMCFCVSPASSEGVLAIVYAIVCFIVIIFRVSCDRWRHVSNAFSASVMNIYIIRVYNLGGQFRVCAGQD